MDSIGIVSLPSQSSQLYVMFPIWAASYAVLPSGSMALRVCASFGLIPCPSYIFNSNVCLLGSCENRTSNGYSSKFFPVDFEHSLFFICCNKIAGFIPLLTAHKYMDCAIWSADYLMEIFYFTISSLDMISVQGLWFTVTSSILHLKMSS